MFYKELRKFPQKNPRVCLRVRKKAVLLHPLSGTEAARD